MSTSKVFFDKSNHEFSIDEKYKLKDEIISEINAPLSVILQVTRRCNLTCNFCSESAIFKDPKIDDLFGIIQSLKGVQRVYLSGGEPLVRKDIFDIIDVFHKEFPVLGLPTNTTKITKDVCEKIRGKVSYINAGLDGPRFVNDKIRGGFDDIINGLHVLRDNGIEVSLSTVILRETVNYLQYVVQIADVLDITKVKMVIPVLRGRASALKEEDFAMENEIISKFNEIKNLKTLLGWRPRIKFTFWDKSTEGYALIIFPSFDVHAWPVFNQPDAVLKIGNLREESIQDIWKKYPFKENHLKKYTGIRMHKA